MTPLMVLHLTRPDDQVIDCNLPSLRSSGDGHVDHGCDVAERSGGESLKSMRMSCLSTRVNVRTKTPRL